MDDCRGWGHQTTLPDDGKQKCISGVLRHWRVYKEMQARKEKKKKKVHEEQRRQTGKMECGIENE